MPTFQLPTAFSSSTPSTPDASAKRHDAFGSSSFLPSNPSTTPAGPPPSSIGSFTPSDPPPSSFLGSSQLAESSPLFKSRNRSLHLSQSERNASPQSSIGKATRRLGGSSRFNVDSINGSIVEGDLGASTNGSQFQVDRASQRLDERRIDEEDLMDTNHEERLHDSFRSNGSSVGFGNNSMISNTRSPLGNSLLSFKSPDGHRLKGQLQNTPARGVKRSFKGPVTATNPHANTTNTAISTIANEVAQRQGPAPLQEPNDFIFSTEDIMSDLYSRYNQDDELYSVRQSALASAAENLSRVWASHYPPREEQATSQEEPMVNLGPIDNTPEPSKAVFISDILLRLHHPPNARGKQALVSTGSTRMTRASNISSDIQKLWNPTAIPKILIHWLENNHNPWKEIISHVESARPNPATSPNFWDVTFILILRGQIRLAMSLLASSDFNHAETAMKDGEADGYTRTQIANIHSVVKRATEVLSMCPGVVDDDWHVTASDWSRFRGFVHQTIQDLVKLAEGRENDLEPASPSYKSARIGTQKGIMSHSHVARKATSRVPWTVYQSIKTIYGILLGGETEIVSSAQDWVEATIGLTIWWNGHDDGRVAVGSLAKTRRSLHRFQSKNQRLVDIDAEAAYMERLGQSFSLVTDENDHDSFQIDSNAPNQVALASVFQGDFQAVLRLLHSWSLPIATTVAEIATLGGWSTTASTSAVMDELDEGDLMILEGFTKPETALRRHTLMLEYSNALCSAEIEEKYEDKAKDKQIIRTGWQVAIGILARLGDKEFSQNEIRKILRELNLELAKNVDIAVAMCTKCGMETDANSISTKYADLLVSKGEKHGKALICYARAGLEHKVRHVLDILISLSLAKSVAFPPASTLQEKEESHLPMLLNFPQHSVAYLADTDKGAAYLVQRLFAGYATLRRFYNTRDDVVDSEEDEKASFSAPARKAAAFEHLIALIRSAADSIQGGLYDEDAGAVVKIDALLVLLGEASVYVNQTTEPLPFAQCLLLLRVIEDLETVDDTIYDRCEAFFKSTIASYHQKSDLSSSRGLLKSISGKSEESSFSLVGSSMLNSQSSEKMNQWESMTESQDQVKRGWDWRAGTTKDTKGADILVSLRTGLARDIARHWIDGKV